MIKYPKKINKALEELSTEVTDTKDLCRLINNNGLVKTYQAFAQFGKITAGDLIHSYGMSEATSYRTLKNLSDLGLIKKEILRIRGMKPRMVWGLIK